MFFAMLVYAKVTTLGDTPRYLAGGEVGMDFWYNSTHMVGTVAYLFSQVVGDLLANIPFVILSFFGIYYSVSRLDINRRQLFFLLVLLSFPSFGIWTSVASKEAVAVFFMGILLGAAIDYIKGIRLSSYFLVWFALYLCILFKPQYLIGIFSLFVFIYLSKKLSLSGGGKLLLLLLFFIFSFLILFLFRSEINDLSFIIPAHFSLSAGSTRENTIWVNDFDVFWNAPYGMFIAFVGPTFSEALTKPAQLIAWVESMAILLVFFVGLLKLTMVTYETGRVNIYYVGLFLTVTLWILFVHYPFGALNPGSAIRYRENFYGFLVVFFYYIYTQAMMQYSQRPIKKQ